MSKLLRTLATVLVAMVALTGLTVPVTPAAASGWPIAVGDTSIGRPSSIMTHPDGRTYVCDYSGGTRDLLAVEENGSVFLDQPDEPAALDLCRRHSRPINNIGADGVVYGVKSGSYEPTLVVAYDGSTEVWSQQIPGRCSTARGGISGPFVTGEGEVYFVFGSCGDTILAQFDVETGQVVATHTLANNTNDASQVRQYADGLVHQTEGGDKYTFYPFADIQNPLVYEPSLSSGDIPADWRVDPSGRLVFSVARNDTACGSQVTSRIVVYDGSEVSHDIRSHCLRLTTLEVTPSGVALLGFAVASKSDGRLVLINDEGVHIKTLPSHSSASQLRGPNRLQIDLDGRILLVRPYETRIEGDNYDHAEFFHFDADGSPLSRSSTESIDAEEDHNVRDLALQNGYVYALISGSYSLEKTLHKLPFSLVGFDYVRGTLMGVNPGQTEPLKYVAMGDSFSSGEGVEPFLGGTTESPEQCHRSELAYPRLLAADPSLPWVMADENFMACSGAVIPDVVTSGQHPGMPRQLDALSGGVDVVTISIGGNDVGFGEFAEACVLDVCAIGTDIHTQTVDNISSELVGANGLESVYEQILSAAPNATLYVLDYPHVTPFDGQPATTRCPYLSASLGADARAAHDVTARISSAIETAVWNVQQESERIHFVTANGLNSPFEGHDVCSSDPYFHGVDIVNTVYSFHPNQSGQEAYHGVMEGYLN